MIGWLTDVTNWLREQFVALFNAVVQFFKDFIIYSIEGMLNLVETIVSAIPLPDFLTEYTICGLLMQAGPTASWVVDTFHVAEGMALLTSAFAFRMLRKLLTLFQW